MKFRVYNKIEKKYETSKDFFISQDGILHRLNTIPFLCAGCYTVEFSTGLLDKNGVEIFDGDKVSNGYNEEYVFYNEIRAMFDDDWIITSNIHNEIEG